MAVARTYGKLEAARDPMRGEVFVIAELEPHVRIRLKHIFPRVRKTDPPPYVFPADPEHAADLDWFTQRYPLAAEPGVLAALKTGRRLFEREQAEVERILAPDWRPSALHGLRPGMQVRPYQAQAVELLAHSGGLLVGDEVGLGKTYVAAGACLLPGALPATIVCFPHLARQWVKVIESFTTLTAHAVTGTRPYALPPVDVRVFRYTQLQGWSDMFEMLGCGLVAFDEVQDLRKGRGTAKGAAAWQLAQVARYRLGLSATPIYNYADEIYRILSLLSPGVLSGFDEFLREWTGGSGKVSDPKALGTYLREKHVFLRRTKADVGQDMPPVNRIIDVIDYDVAEMRSVDELAERLAVRATTGDFHDRGEATRELDLRVRHATGLAKAKNVAAMARIIVEGGAPIVLVGWHRDVYEVWLKELGDLEPAMYTGSEGTAAKNASAQRFLDGDTDVLIMSLRSGAGLDGLQRRCSTMVFGELDWSPGVHHQCIGRLDREGQAEPVTAIFLVVEEGSDPPMMEVLGLKASEAAQVLDPSLGVQAAGGGGGSHLQGLVQRYLHLRAGKPPPRRITGPKGDLVSPQKLACLAELAKCGPRGTAAVRGVMDGGLLSALVQFGLAERLPEDRLGGLRYGISADGVELLRLEGLAPPAEEVAA